MTRRLASSITAIAAACAACAACAGQAAAPPSDRIFVSQAASASIAVIDAASGIAEARIPVGMLPHELVLSRDGTRLYVALVGSQAVAEIDVAEARVRRTLATGSVPERRDDGSVIQAHIDQGAAAHDGCADCHRPGGAQPKYAGDRPFG